MVWRIFSILAVLVLGIVPMDGHAQKEGEKEAEEGTIEPRKYLNRGRDRIIIDYNMDQWVENIPGVELKNWSPGGNIYYMADYIVKNSGFSIAVGFGLGSTNFNTNSRPVAALDAATQLPITELTPLAPTHEYKKNKMSFNYLEVPLELRLRTRRRNTWRFYPGFKAGYMVNFHTKLKDDLGKFKEYNTRFIRKYRFGPTIRMGIGKINFTAFYSLTHLFEDGRGPVITPFTFGYTFYVL